MKDVAIYGGSFNPPGLHHRRIVEELTRKRWFDEILVIPCGGRPDKLSVNVIPPHHRTVMTNLTFANILHVSVSLFDLEQDTYTPACDLQKRFGHQVNLFHVVGADLVIGGGKGSSQIQTSWKKGREIWETLNFVVVTREGVDLPVNDLPPRCCLLRDFENPGSSTVIRNKLFRGESVEGLVMPTVADYIERHGLYINSCCEVLGD